MIDFNMANNDNSLAVSPFDFQSFKKPRPVQAWIPLPGTKRKASSANIDDKFDPDCSPAPAKQFAVDEDIANEILRDGFYYDPSIPEVKVKVMESIAEDEEMEDGTSTVDRDPGDPSPKTAKRRLPAAQTNLGTNCASKFDGSCTMETAGGWTFGSPSVKTDENKYLETMEEIPSPF
ncbi:hypothetical protein Ocin01_06397 [Orchesella cincta]|uniref:Uncharacterized protein n=1 Tax=Orchesella cincta TaxID=48709 RepID=A0A1D2N4T7_ORCCI|nr:hypothetical protein Ocin01_06397 [Orchesella cincta]